MSARLPLPPGWGAAEVRRAGAHAPPSDATARSYDHLGDQLAWTPGEAAAGRRFACDTERADRPGGVPAWFPGADAPDFLDRWVVTEVLAKLADVPVALWVKRHGLAAAPPAGAPAEVDLAAFGARGAATVLLLPQCAGEPRAVAMGILDEARSPRP